MQIAHFAPEPGDTGVRGGLKSSGGDRVLFPAMHATAQHVSETALPLAPARSGPVLVAGQELVVFDDPAHLISAMVEDIRRARRRVWLEIYIVMNDGAGLAVARALMERARAGLDVRLIYDAFGCLSTPVAFFDGLREAGVRVHEYHGWWQAFRAWSFPDVLNRRDHRKLLVIDDQVAYFGGMNLVDHRRARHVADRCPRGLPASAGWRDIHVRLQGSRQAEVALAFDRLWRRVHGQRAPAWRGPSPASMLAQKGEWISFFENRPHLRRRTIARVFVPLIRKARRRLTVSMAYFLPVGRILRELLRAARRGVKVRVIVPAESDVKLVQWASSHLYARLLRHGIRVYERRGCMLHSKVLVVDDRWTVVGSANLDPRSLRLNLEFMAVMASEPLAAVMNRICAHDLRHSRRVTPRAHETRRYWQVLRDRLAWSLRGWL